MPASYHAWHPAVDNLLGTEAYGDNTDDSKPWSIKYDRMIFNEIRFATVNLKHYVDYDKSNIIGKIYEFETMKPVLRSSTGVTEASI